MWSFVRHGLMLPLPLLALILTGCQTTRTAAINPAAIQRTCEALPFVSYSSRDTAETQQGVREHNARREAFCK